jgi:hypothetical protein
MALNQLYVHTIGGMIKLNDKVELLNGDIGRVQTIANTNRMEVRLDNGSISEYDPQTKIVRIIENKDTYIKGMKMKKTDLQAIIREEVRKTLKEANPAQAGMTNLLMPMIGGLMDQFDTFVLRPKEVNIEISPKSVRSAVKIYDTLLKNKESIKSFLTQNGLPNAKLYLAMSKYGFGGGLVVIITSKPKLPNVFIPSEETDL